MKYLFAIVSLVVLSSLVLTSCSKEVEVEKIVYQDRIVEVLVQDQTRINELQAQIDALSGDNSSLQAELDSLQSELDAALEMVEVDAQTIASLEERISELEDQLEVEEEVITAGVTINVFEGLLVHVIEVEEPEWVGFENSIDLRDCYNWNTSIDLGSRRFTKIEGEGRYKLEYISLVTREVTYTATVAVVRDDCNLLEVDTDYKHSIFSTYDDKYHNHKFQDDIVSESDLVERRRSIEAVVENIDSEVLNAVYEEVDVVMYHGAPFGQYEQIGLSSKPTIIINQYSNNHINKVAVHEYMHAVHDLIVEGGYENAFFKEKYAEAKALYPDSTKYWTLNANEFVAEMMSLYLYYSGNYDLDGNYQSFNHPTDLGISVEFFETMVPTIEDILKL